MKRMGKKGVFPLIVTALMAILVAGAFVYGAIEFGLNQAAQRDKTEQETAQLDVLTGGATPGTTTGAQTGLSGQYSYADIFPYINFKFEDAVGTAVNPTVYLYTKDPSIHLTANGPWNSERSWSDTTGTYWTYATASSGTASKQIPPYQDAAKTQRTTVWFHASLSGYKDVFGSYTVPLRGDVAAADAKSNSTGLDAGTWKMPQYDTSTVASSIDLGHDATNHTNYELVKSISSISVASGKEMCLGRVKLTNVNKSVVNKVSVVAGGRPILIYDENGNNKLAYADATDAQTYDSDNNIADKTLLEGVCFAQNTPVAILLDVFADTTDTTWASTSYLSNGNVTFKANIYNSEGTALVSAVSVTA